MIPKPPQSDGGDTKLIQADPSCISRPMSFLDLLHAGLSGDLTSPNILYGFTDLLEVNLDLHIQNFVYSPKLNLLHQNMIFTGFTVREIDFTNAYDMFLYDIQWIYFP